MRGYPNLNKDLFAKVAEALRSMGLTVWSPSEQASYIKLSFAQCISLDLNMVNNSCRKIVFLPGWRESLGANMEAFTAFACKKEAFEIIFEGYDIEDMAHRTNKVFTHLELVPLDLSHYLLPKRGIMYESNIYLIRLVSPNVIPIAKRIIAINVIHLFFITFTLLCLAVNFQVFFVTNLFLSLSLQDRTEDTLP
jgi:hypothetical protein